MSLFILTLQVICSHNQWTSACNYAAEAAVYRRDSDQDAHWADQAAAKAVKAEALFDGFNKQLLDLVFQGRDFVIWNKEGIPF